MVVMAQYMAVGMLVKTVLRAFDHVHERGHEQEPPSA